VALLRTDVSEEHITAIMRVKRISELLKNIDSYKSHMASHPRR
jgi:hypothetical protein